MGIKVLIPLHPPSASYERLQKIMTNPQAIIVEARALPSSRHPEWCRWGSQGLQCTWDRRYYYFSDKSYGSGVGTTENWLSNKNEAQSDLDVELVNAKMGIRFLLLGLEQEKVTVLLCPSKGKRGVQQWKLIVEILKQQIPDLQVCLENSRTAYRVG